MTNVNGILAERDKTHGDFATYAACTQDLKVTMCRHMVGAPTDVQQEAIDMICLKLGRIAAGDSWVRDHWDDIAGYATLVSQRLPGGQDDQ